MLLTHFVVTNLVCHACIHNKWWSVPAFSAYNYNLNRTFSTTVFAYARQDFEPKQFFLYGLSVFCSVCVCVIFYNSVYV